MIFIELTQLFLHLIQWQRLLAYSIHECSKDSRTSNQSAHLLFLVHVEVSYGFYLLSLVLVSTHQCHGNTLILYVVYQRHQLPLFKKMFYFTNCSTILECEVTKMDASVKRRPGTVLEKHAIKFSLQGYIQFLIKKYIFFFYLNSTVMTSVVNDTPPHDQISQHCMKVLQGTHFPGRWISSLPDFSNPCTLCKRQNTRVKFQLRYHMIWIYISPAITVEAVILRFVINLC